MDRAMTREEYKALRARHRETWSAEAKRQDRLARHNIRRFLWFMAGMTTLAAILGAGMH